MSADEYASKGCMDRKYAGIGFYGDISESLICIGSNVVRMYFIIHYVFLCSRIIFEIFGEIGGLVLFHTKQREEKEKSR